MVYFENMPPVFYGPLYPMTIRQPIQAKCPGCGRCLVCGQPQQAPIVTEPYWHIDPFEYPTTSDSTFNEQAAKINSGLYT